MPPRDRTKRRVVPRQRRAVASVDAILTAAARVLESEGYAAATTNRIAEVAGVNVALLYRYFAGREAIVGALVERAAAQTLEAVRAALELHAEAPLPRALRALVDVAVDTPGMSAALHRELVEHVDLTNRRPAVHALREQLGALFVEFVASRSRELRPLGDPPAMIFVVGHALEAAAHAAAFYRPRELDRERVVSSLVELLLRALAPVVDDAPPPPRPAKRPVR